jgi:cytochrome b561
MPPARTERASAGAAFRTRAEAMNKHNRYNAWSIGEAMKTLHYMLGLTVFGIVFVRLALRVVPAHRPLVLGFGENLHER